MFSEHLILHEVIEILLLLSGKDEFHGVEIATRYLTMQKKYDPSFRDSNICTLL